jgi:Large polyvalent protein associated domain 39
LDEVNELDELISNYKLKDPEYARELEQERKRAVKEFDKAGGSTEFDKQDVWVAFEPNQIKSVFNKGTWSPESDVILENRVGTEEIIMDAARLDIYPSESMDKLVMSGPEFKDIKKNTAEYIKDLSIDRADVLLSTLNLRQLGEMASSSLPQVKEFYKAVSDMLAMRDTRITLAADIAKRWVAFNEAHPKIAQVLADVMHAATIAGIDPDVNLEKIRSQELLDNWEIISKDKEALAIYRDVRDYYAESLNKYEKALKQRITESMEEGRPKTQALLELEQEFNKIRQTGPYFPLARFGDYWVSYNTVDENNQKVPEYYMFESRSEQRKFIDDLVKEGIKYKSGIKTSEMLSQGVPMSGFVRNMMELVDKTGGDTDTLKDGIWQMFLTMQPDLSARKHFIHRKKVKGYSNDALRAFAETSFHGAYHLARVQFNGRLEAIVLQAKKHKEDEPSIEAERYYEELLKRKEWVNAPEDVNSFTSWATSFSFMYFLTAPASALVNIAQTPMIAFPYLGAKFGFGNAFKELSRASKEFFASGISKEKGFYDITRTLKARAEEEGLSQAELQRRQEELQAITKLYEDGTLNRTQTLSLAGLAERPSDILQGGIGAVLRNRAFTTQQKVTYILGYSFNQAEVFNRQITAISAYRSARNKGMTHDLALQTAKDIVNETHFEYTNATKPRFMQGPTARILFQFKNYAQQMTYLLVRTVNEAIRGADQETKTEARKRLGAILFMTGLFAGYEGLPLMWVIEGVMNAMFDDEDEPYDFFNSSKNNIADLFGSNAARILSGGLVSEILGGDVAGRVGMNGMWFRDSNRSVDEVQAFNQFVADLAGPFVGIGANIADGLKKINDGHYMRGTEAMLPPVLKDFLKVARFSTEGATTLRGDPIVGEISTWGLFMQALGFTPTDLARSYTAMGEIKGMENDLDRRRKRLIQQTALADMNGDIDALMEVKEKISRFNEKNPNNPITEETIKRSKSQRTKDSERAVRGIIVNPKREYLLEEARYLGEEE